MGIDDGPGEKQEGEQMTRDCKTCDGTGHRFLGGVATFGNERCRECHGLGEVDVVCEWCNKPLAIGEVDICDACAELYDRQDIAERLSCEHCQATGGGCIVCRPTIALPEGETPFVAAKM